MDIVQYSCNVRMLDRAGPVREPATITLNGVDTEADRARIVGVVMYEARRLLQAGLYGGASGDRVLFDIQLLYQDGAGHNRAPVYGEFKVTVDLDHVAAVAHGC